MSETKEILDAMLGMKGDIGQIKGTLETKISADEQGRKNNIAAQKAIRHEISGLRDDLSNKMDKREYGPLVFLNTVLSRPKLAIFLLSVFGGGGTAVAWKWSDILKLFGGGQ